MRDLIDRQAAIDALGEQPDSGDWMDEWACGCRSQWEWCKEAIENVPDAQPEIIRCKDCKWWDKYSDTHGYCLAAKHGYWSEHWDISIRRTYDADWYCADAERRTDG